MAEFVELLGNKPKPVADEDAAEDEDIGDLDDLLAETNESMLETDKTDKPQDEQSNLVTAPNEDEDLIKEADAGPKVRTFDLLRQENCIHEVAVPSYMQYVPLETRQTRPAKTYIFQLDSFQSEAINCVDNYQSVLVSAHTSAGKTAIALYAVALALRENQRVIYTSPIKALSNQKYRELLEEFGDVGLMTGDVTLNPEASCLVMTTEILRSMLYRGSEIMREVGWVIFDEIHYMRDEERGVVWEETIILLPDNVHYVFLSATIPNAKQFAEWIAVLHKQSCHVVYTDYRPTPLQHVFYSSGANGLYEVVSARGEFREDQFQQAMSYVSEKAPDERQNRKLALQQTANSVVTILRTIRERELMPVIVFSFSRRECEAYATSLKDMDFNDHDQKDLIRKIFFNAVSILGPEDQKLPQIKWILPYLVRGIGIHHSGLLPLLKECIEILFGEGLLRILFATETFAMGLNMPARTVLFTSARKFDGKDTRWINSGEYIQMSGRAGRRGKDPQGLCILMVDQKMSDEVAKKIVKGQTDPLNSQFRLTYNMVLNLIRVPDVNPEYMMERSFRYFQNKAMLVPLYEKYKARREQLDRFEIPFGDQLTAYNQLIALAEDMKKKIQAVVIRPKYITPYFQTGRLFRVRTKTRDLGWGALLNHKKTINKMGDTIYILELALRLSWECVKNIENVEELEPPPANESAALEYVPVELSSISAISTMRIKLPESPEAPKAKEAIKLSLERSMKKFAGKVPEFDPIQMGVKDQNVLKDIEKLKDMEARIADHPLRKREDFAEIQAAYNRKVELTEQLRIAREEIKKVRGGQFTDELRARERVLRRLQYVDSYGQITAKGRIACEISAADEILLTEMILSGVFKEMQPPDAAALLSCFVFEEKTDKTPPLDDQLQGAFKTLITHAKKVAKISNECKFDLDESLYVDKLKNGMMWVVKQWCSGASFQEISENSGIFEGSIIRCMRRLEELIRQMICASQAMGDEKMAATFEEASKKLKRDIVFAASLYL
ncbi:unnamed protein product [Bursaphelenchus xylophilus]|uniref:(pine wood nematode) hypothetical protein n=1 Tax=Bursaphelenchus xylophilus TaxID=6326 RepID=A0A1I7S1H2_BURXY|nr:unnamed protein product [Bursaphelenchus xylophilus]CAG9081496.1 unnamed protein product [Bursaphelenchus xylophilus]